MANTGGPGAGGADRLPGVDMLRGLAVAGVFCNHLGAYLGVQVPWIGRLGGLLGVELFFVVSGYLILRSCSGQALAPYLVRRLFRIFPVYWVVVLGLTFIGPVGAKLLAGPELWTAFLLNLFALPHLYPPALAGFDVTTVAWSLTVEWLWYLLAPALVLVWRPAGRRAALIMLIGGVLASVGWVWVVQRGWLDAWFLEVLWQGAVPAMSDFHRYAYLANAAPAQLAFFGVGAALAVAGADLGRRPAHRAWTPAAGLLALLALPAVLWADRANAWAGLNPSPLPALGLGMLFWAVYRVDPASLGRNWPGWSARAGLAGAARALGVLLDRLGRISYPFYLVHVPAILLVKGWWPATGAPSALVQAALALALAWAGSELLHRLVENPGITAGARLARWFRARQAPG